MTTATACWLAEPGRAELRDEELGPVPPNWVRVRTLYSAISRGTESLVFHGRIPPGEYQRMQAPFQEGSFPAPVKYGYINVGRIEDGPAELRGHEVFCLYPHQNLYQVPASAVTPLVPGLPADRAVLVAGMETAVNVLWDAEIKLGDRVCVIGAGVIGSLCAYLAARVPNTRVHLVDTNAERSQLARALGVEFGDPGDDFEADVVIHASGSPSGLSRCLELAGMESLVVEMSWYGDRSVPLPLGGAFHSKRLQIRSSQVGRLPASQSARWDYARRLRCAMELLRDSTLGCLISGESAFADLPAALSEICSASGPLCHRIRYPGAQED